MTFIIGFVWRSGVVMVSDSRAVMGFTAEEERKLYPVLINVNDIEHDLAVIGGAGNASLVKQGFEIISNHFKKFFLENSKYPSSRDIDVIVNNIQRELVSKYYELRTRGIIVDIELMLGLVSAEGEPKLYVFSNNGLYEPRHESPGYAMIGIGRDTGGLLLLNLLGYDKDKSNNWDMSIFTTFLIDLISSVNPYVSPLTSFLDSFYIRWDDNEKKPVMGPLKPEAFIEAKTRSSKRISIYRMLWDIIETTGEDRVQEILENIKKQNNIE